MSTKSKAETPMMKQYREARESLEDDTLLLFRLGDFYEMFETDAERGAAIFRYHFDQKTRDAHGWNSFSRSGRILDKTSNHGHKVAICDQLEVAQTGSWLNAGLPEFLHRTVLEDRTT